MEDYIQRMWDYREGKPGARIVQKEFWYFCIDKWAAQGHVKSVEELEAITRMDPPAIFDLMGLGWTEAGLCPEFETKVLEDLGDYELVQDFAGRSVLYFKGRRNGFMPEYRDHPVKDMQSLKEKIAWRMDPATPERWRGRDALLAQAKAAQAEGKIIRQKTIGGFMYLRSLMGPEELLYKFIDEPELIHRCMELWFRLADAVIADDQKHVDLDEIFFGEDICYNHGPLISPDMIREFLFPYYQQLLSNARARQRDKSRKIYFQLDTDGDCRPVIPLYKKELGMDILSPLEIASGSDPLEIAAAWPDLRLNGGFDKRVLARGKDAIAREVDRILPVMVARGGYYPTCDHGVPEEVEFEDYLYFRELLHQF